MSPLRPRASHRGCASGTVPRRPASPPAVLPDVTVPVTSAEAFAGRDPVLEVALRADPGASR